MLEEVEVAEEAEEVGSAWPSAALPAAEAILKEQKWRTESYFSQIFVERGSPGLCRRANGRLVRR